MKRFEHKYIHYDNNENENILKSKTYIHLMRKYQLLYKMFRQNCEKCGFLYRVLVDIVNIQTKVNLFHEKKVSPPFLFKNSLRKLLILANENNALIKPC